MSTLPVPRTAVRGHLPTRIRLLVAGLSPLVVLLVLLVLLTVTTGTASAASPSRPSDPVLVWANSWTPPLPLLSDYRKCCPSSAGFLALPDRLDVLASQRASATTTFMTRWVDWRAEIDSPNIAQQGLYNDVGQFKLQIGHGPGPAEHRGQCRVKGRTAAVLAVGPAIDVADGGWHTITCIKSADTATRTTVTVVVDGVAGSPKVSTKPVGDVHPPGALDLGGRSAVASSDSLDGWISSIEFWLG